MQRDLGPDAVGRLAGDHLGRRQRLARPAPRQIVSAISSACDQRHGEAQHQEEGEHGPAHHLGGQHVGAGGDRRRHRPGRWPTAPPGRRSRPVPPCRASGQRHRKTSISGSDRRQRPGRAGRPLREALDRAGPGELRLAVGVPQAPVAARLAFEVVGLPRLVDRLDHEVVDVLRLQPRHHVAHVLGLLGGRRVLDHADAGAAPRRAVRRPADLGDDDVLVRVRPACSLAMRLLR